MDKRTTEKCAYTVLDKKTTEKCAYTVLDKKTTEKCAYTVLDKKKNNRKVCIYSIGQKKTPENNWYKRIIFRQSMKIWHFSKSDKCLLAISKEQITNQEKESFLRNFLFYGISENFLFRKSGLFAITKGNLTTIEKVGNLSRGWPKGFLFNSYYTDV